MNRGKPRRCYQLDLPIEFHKALKNASNDEGITIQDWIMQTVTPVLLKSGYLPRSGKIEVTS